MKPYLVIATSACGLDYYEQSHDNIKILYGKILIRPKDAEPFEFTDIEDICAVNLQAIYQSGHTDFDYTPPSSEIILSSLKQYLADGYQQLFLISSPHPECQQNFADAVARLPPEAQRHITIYNSISAGFCTSVLALSANKLLKQNTRPAIVCEKLAAIESRSIFFYTSLNIEQAPYNPLTDTLRQSPCPKDCYPLAKIIGHSTKGYETEKIANLPDLESLIDTLVTEIRHHIGDNPCHGFIVCPCNYNASLWFCETLSKRLKSKKPLPSMPIMPEHLKFLGAESFAVRIYHPDDYPLVVGSI